MCNHEVFLGRIGGFLFDNAIIFDTASISLKSLTKEAPIPPDAPNTATVIFSPKELRHVIAVFNMIYMPIIGWMSRAVRLLKRSGASVIAKQIQLLREPA